MKQQLTFIQICLVFCAVYSTGGSAATTSQTQAAIGLLLDPKSCVVTQRNQFCQQKVEVLWSLKEPLNVCLFVNTVKDMAACSSGLISHETTVLLNTQKDVAFELRENNTGLILYSHLFKVYKTVVTRRKRRNPWSFY